MTTNYPFHEEATADSGAPPAEVFALLDDHRRLSAHMASSSPMMAGASMRLDTDERLGRAVGSRMRLSGRVLGLRLAVEEAVTVYQPPALKVWETLGQPRLVVIGRYRMGFSVRPLDVGSRVTLWIDYDWPSGGLQRWLGRVFGRLYARWCTAQMIRGL